MGARRKASRWPLPQASEPGEDEGSRRHRLTVRFLSETATSFAERRQALIAEEYALRDLRKAKHLTQTEVAEQLGGRQVYVSRLEKRSDMKLSTLRDYVRALGGELKIMVTFPEGETVKLKSTGGQPPRAPRRPRKSKAA